MSNAVAVKRCNRCGAEHTQEQWERLAYVGLQDDGTEVLEYRNCSCLSTLAIVLGPSLHFADTVPAPALEGVSS